MLTCHRFVGVSRVIYQSILLSYIRLYIETFYWRFFRANQICRYIFPNRGHITRRLLLLRSRRTGVLEQLISTWSSGKLSSIFFSEIIKISTSPSQNLNELSKSLLSCFVHMKFSSLLKSAF